MCGEKPELSIERQAHSRFVPREDGKGQDLWRQACDAMIRPLAAGHNLARGYALNRPFHWDTLATNLAARPSKDRTWTCLRKSVDDPPGMGRK
jgi:hypothetical protein